MKHSIKVLDNTGYIHYNLPYYTIAGRYLVCNYDAKVICVIDNY